MIAEWTLNKQQVNRQNVAVLGKVAHLYFNVNKYDPDPTWADVLLRKVGNSIREIVDTNDFTDHYMDNYLIKLKTLAEFTGWHDR
jgi:hypothetical protein